MAQELILLSPEKAVLSFRLATIGSRIVALFLDLCLIGAAFLVTAIILGILGAFQPETLGGFAVGTILVLASLGPFLYFILFEGLWNGQTIGKKALGIRVRQSDGTPATMTAVLGRNLLRAADLLPGTGFVGLVAMFTNPRCQRLGDLVADTVVVFERKPEPVFAASPHTVGLHPLESSVGNLERMSIEEYQAIRRLCDRFPELPREMQQKMMREIWMPFAKRHDLPSFAGVDPIYVAEAVVMRYGRIHGLL